MKSMKGLSDAIKGLIAALFAGMFLCVPPAYGQVVMGSIVGTITDSSGGVVPAAKVTVTNVDTDISRAFTTDASGYYSVPDLPPSSYKVSAEKEGFSVGTHTDIALFAAQTVRVDITLQPGSVSQSVTVAGGEAAKLQTDTAQTGRDLNSSVVEDLPLSQGHNFQNLLNLSPGTEPAIRQHSFFYNPENSMSSPTNGLPSRANTFNIEGINDNDHGTLLQPYIVPMETIQEVGITTSNYDPSEGTALGSVINVIVKSGSNQFHGEGYEFYTGNGLQARGFFNQGTGGKPFKFTHSVDNYFGANLGGPIQKEKTFFFFDYLRHPQRLGNNYTFSVPTAAMKLGDFSDPALPVIYDPSTGDTADCFPGGNASRCGTGRTQIHSGGAPNMLTPDPVAKTLMSHVLPPNANLTAPGLLKYQNNLIISSVFQQNVYDITFKIDRYQGPHDHISGRFSYTNPIISQAGIFGDWGGPLNIGTTNGYEGKGFRRTFSDGINWVHVFSPTLLSQARVGLSRFRNDAVGIGYGQNLNAQVGILGVNLGPFSSGVASINGEGFSDPLIGVANSFPWYHGQTNIIVTENVSKIHGGHTFEFGLDYSRIRDDYLLGLSPMGQFSFSSGTTSLNGGSAGNFANAFASTMLSVPSSTYRGYVNAFPTYRQNEIFPYAGDRWQVTPKLTLNLGLRWEYYGSPTPEFAAGMSNYNPSTNTLDLAGVGNVPRNQGLAADLHNFGPRVGVAYRLSGNNVLRAGFGITTMTFPIDTWDYNYPIQPTQQFTNISSFGPALLNNTTAATLEQGFTPLPPYSYPASGHIPAPTNSGYFYLPLNWKNPYIMSWNLAYERSLPGNWVLDIAYVGNRGVHSPVIYNINAATSYGSGASGQPLYTAYSNANSTSEYFAGFRSKYDSLQVKLDHHFAKNFSVTTSYTYGKAMGYQNESGDYPAALHDYVNLRKNWAPPDFNLGQIFNQSLVWRLPFGTGESFLKTGVASQLLGGWQLSGVWSFHTGFPFNFSAIDPGFNTPGSQAFPNETGPFRRLHGIQNQPWFDTSVFSVAAAKTQGNVGSYVYGGPNYFNLDASLFRTIKFTERVNLELRTEWLHATNTPQFANPNTTVGNPNFGLVSSATGARVVDFAARVMF